MLPTLAGASAAEGAPPGPPAAAGGRELSGPLPRLGLAGRWRRRFPGSPAPDADGGAFRPSPNSFSPAVAGAGEAEEGGEPRREGERAEVAWCRRRRREEEVAAAAQARPGAAVSQ